MPPSKKNTLVPHRTTQLPQKLKATATNACGRLLRVDDGTGDYNSSKHDSQGGLT